ncbi:Protein of unknown function [Cotesia congregata]|uniref:Uncharacterized protein n=1 Tax=Cotesia congregata TaxID=51543 RepID=A0A8J2HL01_COTCN|nr:Protein of unknown function [Cotesia congregata]
MIKLVLKHYIVDQKKLSIDNFNNRISSFQWGYCEMKNKPSANFTVSILRRKEHTLSQKAMQTWNLIRAIPILLSDVIDSDDEHMILVINLLQIMELVFAPKITQSLIPYLDALIREFCSSFKTLFPDINEIHKFHHLSHYPTCILWSGPQANYWCMRYEAKHHRAQVRAEVVHNFKNPPKTLIRVFQCGQSAKWGVKNVEMFQVLKSSGKYVLVQETLSQQFLIDLNYDNHDEIFRSNSLKVNGVEFHLGLYTCLETARLRPDNLPLFGVIDEIIVLNNTDVHLLLSICTPCSFDTSLHAYHIECNADFQTQSFINVLNLAHYKPFSCWNKAGCDALYLSLPQRINGNAFIELTKEDLQIMSIKIGPQKLILKVLSSIMTASSTVNDSIIQPPSSSNNSSIGVNLLFQPEPSTSNITVIDSTKFSV